MTAGVACSLLLAGSLAAQELDVLELDDFIDPLELRSPEGGSYHFLASRLQVGAIERENFRGEFYKSRVHFGRLTTAYYTGQWQLTAKLTDYDTRTHREPPYFRSRAQVARYFGGGHEASFPVRAQVSWTFDQSRTTGSRNEFAFDLSTTVLVRALERPVTGGIVYGYDPHREREYAGASVQVPLIRWRYQSSIRIGGGIAHLLDHESPGTTHSATIAKALLALAQGFSGTETAFYAAYAPAYRNDIREWNHEITLFVHMPVFSRIR